MRRAPGAVGAAGGVEAGPAGLAGDIQRALLARQMPRQQPGTQVSSQPPGISNRAWLKWQANVEPTPGVLSIRN
jgi:hypothetical protein